MIRSLLPALTALALAGCGSDGAPPEPGSHTRDPSFAQTVEAACDREVDSVAPIDWSGYTQKLVVVCHDGSVEVVTVPDDVLENR